MPPNDHPWWTDHQNLRNLIAYLDASWQIPTDDAVANIVEVLGDPWSRSDEHLAAELWTLMGSDPQTAIILADLQPLIAANRSPFESALERNDLAGITALVDELRGAAARADEEAA